MPQPGAASPASHRGTHSRLTRRGPEETPAGLGGSDELQGHPAGGWGVPSSLCDADPPGRCSLSGTILERDPIAVARPALLALGTRSTHGSRAVYLSSMWAKVRCGISVPFVSVFFGKGRRKKKIKQSAGIGGTLVRAGKLFRSSLTQPLGSPTFTSGKDRASGQDAKFPFAVRLFRAPWGGRSGCGLCWELGMSGWSLSRICPLCSRTPSLSIPGSLCLYLLRYYFSITCGANRLFD